MLKDIRKRTLSNIKYSDRKPFKWKDLSVNLPPVFVFPLTFSSTIGIFVFAYTPFSIGSYWLGSLSLVQKHGGGTPAPAGRAVP